MKRCINRRSLAATGASIIAAAALSACGGGGGTTPSVPAAPSSSPTSSPATSPLPSPQSSMTSIAFTSGMAQTLKISESGYLGAFTESDTCNPLTGQIVGITTLSNTQGIANYQVAPIGAGTCAITVTDASGRSTNISVSVATAAITVQ